MKTYQITLICTDPSAVEVKEVSTQEIERERKAQKAIELLTEVFRAQSTKGCAKS